MAKFQELRYELLPHPPYSTDLAPSDYFLFPNLKKWLSGKRFYSNYEIISQTNTYFREILFFERDTKIGETLDEVYRVKSWLYWKIKLLFIKKPLFELKSHAFIDPPWYILYFLLFLEENEDFYESLLKYNFIW